MKIHSRVKMVTFYVNEPPEERIGTILKIWNHEGGFGKYCLVQFDDGKQEVHPRYHLLPLEEEVNNAQ